MFTAHTLLLSIGCAVVFPAVCVVHQQQKTLHQQQQSACVCTTVKCPAEGKNVIVMGSGGAELTYVYTTHNASLPPVVVSASGYILPSSLNKGTDTTACTRAYSRLLDDDAADPLCDAGHILANHLGGYGNIPTNIFPQNASVNRGVYAQFERKISDCMASASRADLEWAFLYKDTTKTMPYEVNYTAVFTDGGDGCTVLSSLFPN